MVFPSIDEGDIAMKIYVKENKLVIDFGKDLTWIGFNKVEVDALIKILQDHSDNMK